MVVLILDGQANRMTCRTAEQAPQRGVQATVFNLHRFTAL
jgi:hypothetical protein